MRYDLPEDSNSEFESGAEEGVLSNLKQIKTVGEIDLLVFVLLHLMKNYALNNIHEDTKFTAKLIRDLHKVWLARLYPWAGKYRTVNIAKGSYAAWCPAINIEAQMLEFESEELQRFTPCRGDLDAVVEAITAVHERFLSIHPFREGNGRLARWLADLMAIQAGFSPLDWREVSESEEGRERYYLAVQGSHAGKMKALTDLIRNALERGQSRAR